MRFLKFLIVSFFILSGCDDLPFSDADIFNTALNSETAKRETKEELNDFKPDNELPSSQNQKEFSITIEEREISPNTKETKPRNQVVSATLLKVF